MNIQWDQDKMAVFEKNFYMEHPAVTSRSEEESEAFRQEKQMTIVGQGIPKVNKTRP
jgi:ATP-dependent RNA helicase DDX5/DBP2